MLKAPIPPNEIKRLHALKRYQILDTSPEEVFDDFTRLASAICETPIAMISLVDENRQWFKSRFGIDAPETPRDPSFCAHAILQEDLFEVENAVADSRFTDNPFVTGELGLRFYAGAPLISPEGLAIGSLCVIDRQPKKLTPMMRDALQTLARQVMAQLELRRLNRELEMHQKTVAQSHKMAALGHMAAGIAHEVNNPLAIIQGKAEMLSYLASKGPVEQAKIEETSKVIQATVGRIVKIIRGLRVFSRSGEQDPRVLAKVSEIVDDTLEFCREKFRHKNIEVRVPKFSEDLALMCRPQQIEQVLLNLLNNSYDHILDLSERWVKVEVVDLGDQIEFSVTDSGQGLEGSAKDRIFEPFFTTKEIGKGVGLGLSISQGLIEEHGGIIRVDPYSRNTRFVFQIPKRPS